MGFYGNISNTSKTTFQFDRTYANKRDMDNGAALGDGVYPGRYVLVDYSQKTNEGFYDIQDSITDESKKYWMYDGKLYLGAPTQTKIGETLLYNYPEPEALITAEDEKFAIGDIVLLRSGARISNLNTASKFVKVTKVRSDGTFELSFDTNYTSYLKWLDEYIAYTIEEECVSVGITDNKTIQSRIAAAKNASYRLVELTSLMYEPNIFFIKDGDKYVQDDVGVFKEGIDYYERVEDPELNIYLTSYTSNIDGSQQGQDVLTCSIDIKEGHIYRIPKWHRYSLNNKIEFWQLYKISSTDGSLVWRALVDDTNSDDNYFKNYSIDRAYIAEFGESGNIGSNRGYDSTVWQKTVVGGQDKYVMIAELNSVVPTFDVAYDAPTGIPMIPHFDKDSTNVYYKLHTQPQWGFRTKSARKLEGPSIDATGNFGGLVNLSTDEIVYPSDQTTVWKSDFYNKFTGEDTTRYFDIDQSIWTTTFSEDRNNVPAAVYYNKKGFMSGPISYSYDLITKTMPYGYDASIAESGWQNVDKISILPTGKSGQKYNAHGSGDMVDAPDTYELSIMLPSIGDTMAKIWDMIFGGRNTNETIRKSNTRNLDYQWEDAKGVQDRHGLRLVHYRADSPYNTAEVNTLAGCINSVHDLMGMIITSDRVDNLTKNLDNLDTERIYYVHPTHSSLGGSQAIKDLQGQYTMKQKAYNYIPVELSSGYVPVKEEEVSGTFKKTDYFIKLKDGSYRQATDTDQGPFYKLVSNLVDKNTTFEKIEDMQAWPPNDGKKYHYLDINTSQYSKVYDSEGNLDLTMQDYVYDNKYQKSHKYYQVVKGESLELSGAYTPGNFLYSDGTGSYWYDFANTSTLGRQYYVLNEDLVQKIKDDYDGIYMPGLYYYYDSDSKEFIKDMSINGTYVDPKDGKVKSRVHYTIKTTTKEDDEKIDYVKQVYFISVSYEDVPTLLVTNNVVYKKDFNGTGQWTDNNGQKFDYVKVSADEEISKDTEYAVEQIIYAPAEESVEIDADNPLNLTPFIENTFFFKKYDDSKTLLGYYPVTMAEVRPEDPEQQFYAFGKKENPNEAYPYYATTDSGLTKFNFALTLQSAFYTPHVYHYISDNGSYILDNYASKTHDSYCTIKNAIPADFGDTVFYEPNEYYTYNPITDEYEIIRDIEKPEDITDFYKGDEYYVYEDTNGVYQKGAKWDINILEVPEGVTLAKREEVWELRPLEGFARQMNTLHGLILKINNMLLAGDRYTRDDSTVQGVINQMQDLIARFDKLTPERFLAVDNYGRVRGMDWSTDQSESSVKTKTLDSDKKGIAADKFAKVADTTDDMYKQWITVNIDGSIGKDKQPLISVHHNFQKVKDSLGNTKNMNVAEENIATDAANKITLQTPFIDEMGHMVGRQETTYTLPFSFKTIKTNGRSTGEAENASSNPTTTSVAADCTQDILTINSGNKWIRIDTNGTNDSLTISHDVHNFVDGNPTTASLSSETSKAITFDTVTYDFDKAGHFTGKTVKTITMPYGYGKITGDSGSTSASATFDTLAFATDNWLTATVTTDKVTFSHDYPDKQDDTTSTSNVNGNGDTIVLETLARDTKGHVTKVNQNTVTLPFGYKTFKDSNATVGQSIAANTQDSFAFKGDSWLKPTVTQGQLVYEHIGPVSSTYTAKSNVTPNFGSTFTIEDWFFDEKGHKFHGGSHTVKIPAPSLTNDSTGNVVTGLALTPSTGAFVETKENLASLKLTGYTAGADKAAVAATDTLGQALSKLQLQSTDLNTALETLNGDEEVEGSVKKQIKGALTEANDNLIYEAPDEADTDFEDKDKTIAWLFQKVAQLEARINDLGVAESETV